MLPADIATTHHGQAKSLITSTSTAAQRWLELALDADMLQYFCDALRTPVTPFA